MGWGPWSSILRQLILPQDAGPDDPQIVIGPTVPAEIQTVVFGSVTFNVLAAIIYRIDAERYFFRSAVGVRDIDPNFVVTLDGVVDLGASGSKVLAYSSVTQQISGGNIGLTINNGASTTTPQRFIEFWQQCQLVMGNNVPGTDLDGETDLNWTIQGVPAPRTYRVFNEDLTTTAAFTTTETVIHSLSNSTQFVNRLHIIKFGGLLQSTVASDRVRLRIRFGTTTAGTLIRECGSVTMGGTGVAGGYPVDVFSWNALVGAGGGGVFGHVLTGQRVAGTGNITYTRDHAWIRDAREYPP